MCTLIGEITRRKMCFDRVDDQNRINKKVIIDNFLLVSLDPSYLKHNDIIISQKNLRLYITYVLFYNDK